MLLNEIINEVGMTKRAVKYYEEKGLLSVDKDNNGYRNYTAQDVETLKKISVYRKLGISIKDIQSLLETGDKSILLRIYQEKVQEKVLKDSELEAFVQFLNGCIAPDFFDEGADLIFLFVRVAHHQHQVLQALQAVLNRLISKILVSEVKKIDGQKVQEVRIIYNFVGEIPEIIV